MPDHDSLAERGRALEEQYFRQKDRELIERIQRASKDEVARRELGAATGLSDPQLLEELQALGFAPDTVSLLPFVPVLQVAWAEAGVTSAERAMIVRLARARGIAEGTPADRQLSGWLDEPPSPNVFASATRLIRAMLDAPAHDPAGLTADELVSYCGKIAAASGGVFGMGWVSSDERSLLTSISAGLRKHPTSPDDQPG